MELSWHSSRRSASTRILAGPVSMVKPSLAASLSARNASAYSAACWRWAALSPRKLCAMLPWKARGNIAKASRSVRSALPPYSDVARCISMMLTRNSAYSLARDRSDSATENAARGRDSRADSWLANSGHRRVDRNRPATPVGDSAREARALLARDADQVRDPTTLPSRAARDRPERSARRTLGAMEGGAARREALAILPKRSPLAVLRKVRGRDAAFSSATARQPDSATARQPDSPTARQRDSATARQRDSATARLTNGATITRGCRTRAAARAASGTGRPDSARDTAAGTFRSTRPCRSRAASRVAATRL